MLPIRIITALVISGASVMLIIAAPKPAEIIIEEPSFGVEHEFVVADSVSEDIGIVSSTADIVPEEEKDLVVEKAAVATVVEAAPPVSKPKPAPNPAPVVVQQPAPTPVAEKPTPAPAPVVEPTPKPAPVPKKESPSATSSGGMTSTGVVSATNAARTEHGLSELKVSTALNAVASDRLKDMFAEQYFAHASPTGNDMGSLVKKYNYSYFAIGENIAMGNYTSSAAMVDTWMNSPGHRANILNTAYSDIGVAVGKGSYKGRDVWIGVQIFGKPR